VHAAPAATGKLVEQVVALVATAKSLPAVTAIPLMLNPWFPLFVTVMGVAALVVPTTWPANATLVFDRVAFGPSPVPVSGTVCGLPSEVSVITRLPVRVPGAVGVNVTVGPQAPPGGNAPQLFVATAKSPVVVTPVTVTDFVVLPFATVTACGALVEATCTFPKLTVASPVSETVCDALPSELSLTISEPYVVPAKAAVKVMLIVQLAPAASDPGQLELAIANGLVATAPEMASGRLPLLVSITLSGALVTPTLWPGKSRFPGEGAATGA